MSSGPNLGAVSDACYISKLALWVAWQKLKNVCNDECDIYDKSISTDEDANILCTGLESNLKKCFCWVFEASF